MAGDGLKVVKILDKKTLMIAGPGVGKLAIGQTIVILGVGKPIPELGGLPVVVPKARVDVTLNAGAYVVAESQEYQQEVNPFELSLIGSRRVTKSDPLNVDEKSVIGNPAVKPIAEGDPAVPEGELTAYVTQLAERLKWNQQP